MHALLGEIYFLANFCILSPIFEQNMMHIWYKCMFASILAIYLIKYTSYLGNLFGGKRLL